MLLLGPFFRGGKNMVFADHMMHFTQKLQLLELGLVNEQN